jgi:peptidoglycan hydrolase-like protein with peptidoglycan-binding domain
MHPRRTLRCLKLAARGRDLKRSKMKKLPIAASLFLASLAYACSASAHPASASIRTPSPQQATTSSAPASSSGATTTTAAKKKKSSKKHHASKREPTQKAPTPERISEIQSALARGGYYQGSPNGRWDSNTVAAMQKFQSENGLSSNGKIDAPSLQKLGLGSGTAGVDAPKPVAPAKSAATSTSSAASPVPATTTTTSASSVTPTPNSATPKRQQ